MNVTTLENLPSTVKENRIKQFGENIVKYQKFKTAAIINKIDNAGYSRATLVLYINSGIGYINNGTKYKQYGDFYKYIDDALRRHVQPLTPAYNERRVKKMATKHKKNKPNEIPVQRVLKEIEQKTSIPKNLKYAVKMNKNLRIMDSIEEARAFKDGLSFMGKTDAEIVKIKMEEV